MRIPILLLLSLALAWSRLGTAGLPAFPGAEGFGSETVAGRGGKVVIVTSLADRGPGTLRAALAHPEPRIIVFRVGGIIELDDWLYVREPFVTVAGQTAPGDGILIKNFGISILTNDVLIQHLRVRTGNESQVRPDINNAITILGRHDDVSGARNVVIDHVSVSWCEDELISTWYSPQDITVSWSIIGEALSKSRHPEGAHSAGLLVGNLSDRVSVHHNLFVHNDFRNPAIKDGGRHAVVGNVVYDWGSLATEIIGNVPGMAIDVIGNRYMPGPSTRSMAELVINPNETPEVPAVFVQGNLGPHRKNADVEDWEIVRFGWSEEPGPQKFQAAGRSATPPIPITRREPEALLRDVLAQAGASRPRRDAIDDRLVRDVRDGTGSIIDSPSQVGGYPQYRTGEAPADADRDGMPDAWEEMQGLNPQEVSDGRADQDGDGYTNVEEYLHSLL